MARNLLPPNALNQIIQTLPGLASMFASQRTQERLQEARLFAQGTENKLEREALEQAATLSQTRALGNIDLQNTNALARIQASFANAETLAGTRAGVEADLLGKEQDFLRETQLGVVPPTPGAVNPRVVNDPAVTYTIQDANGAYQNLTHAQAAEQFSVGGLTQIGKTAITPNTLQANDVFYKSDSPTRFVFNSIAETDNSGNIKSINAYNPETDKNVVISTDKLIKDFSSTLHPQFQGSQTSAGRRSPTTEEQVKQSVRPQRTTQEVFQQTGELLRNIPIDLLKQATSGLQGLSGLFQGIREGGEPAAQDSILNFSPEDTDFLSRTLEEEPLNTTGLFNPNFNQ